MKLKIQFAHRLTSDVGRFNLMLTSLLFVDTISLRKMNLIRPNVTRLFWSEVLTLPELKSCFLVSMDSKSISQPEKASLLVQLVQEDNVGKYGLMV